MSSAIETLRTLPGVKGQSNQFTAKCPAHDDRENSLSVELSDGGKVLVYCHAGCETRDVLAALDLKMADLQPPREAKAKPQIDRTYDYTDADGKLLYQVVRYVPKDFRQRRPDATKPGGWIWKLDGVERVLYHLPAVLKAKAEGRKIYLVEGEKDADAVAALGLVATTYAGGVKGWRREMADVLDGADVVILPDNDAPGHEAARQRAADIQGARILLLPDLPPKGDVSNWIASGGTRDELERLAAEATPDAPAAAVDTSAAAVDVAEADGPDPLSELANAYRFKVATGGNLINCPARGWLVYRGGHWQPGEREAEKACARLGAVIRDEGHETTDDPDRIKQYYSAARKAESARGVANTLQLAKSLPGVDATGIEFDRDEWLVNVANGTVDTRTLTLMPHERSDYLTRCIPIAYDPAARCDEWLRHLKKVFNYNTTMIVYVQFLFGYSITASMRHQLFVICHGDAGVGKTTTIEAAMHAMGPYADAVSHDVVLDTKHPGHACTLAALYGLRFGLVSELPEGARWNEATVKRLATGDTLAARLIGQNPFSFKSTMKLWVNCNVRPEFRDPGGGMARRIRCIPFEVDLTGEGRDLDIEDKLKAEAPGILRWIIEGARMAYDSEPPIPEAVRVSSEQYVKENDLLGNFLAECCEMAPSAQAEKSATYEAFKEWNGGYLSKRKLGLLLATKFDEYRAGGGTRYWIGFRLK